jgi:CheY-like chemotaxis protein
MMTDAVPLATYLRHRFWGKPTLVRRPAALRGHAGFDLSIECCPKRGTRVMAETVVRVLLVDDSPEDRAVSRHFLQQIPEPTYTVVEAETGEDGLAWYQNDPPDCILLDYRLPDLSGLEFLAALAGKDGRVSLPVIMMTGEGNESLVAEAMKAGVADYLPKVCCRRRASSAPLTALSPGSNSLLPLKPSNDSSSKRIVSCNSEIPKYSSFTMCWRMSSRPR